MDTNKLTKEINDILHPRVALIAYASREGESFFVEAREIDGKGKMGEGVPVTVEFMNELVRGYSEHRSNTPYGRIPSNMLWCDSRKGSEKYVWYNPPRKRMMFFKELENTVKLTQ